MQKNFALDTASSDAMPTPPELSRLFSVQRLGATADKNSVRPKTLVGSRRRRPQSHRPRGIVTTLAPDGILQSRGDAATGELVVESCALRWRCGTCG
ncbi:MAG: hypothetical protein ACRBN8_46990 [Nannocystales bacterium]